MASFDYNPFAESVALMLRCPKCGKVMETSVDVLFPDLNGETHSDSLQTSYYDLECCNKKCDFIFEVQMASGICGGDGYIENIDDEDLIDFEDIFPEDDWNDIPEHVYTDYLNPHVKNIRIALEEIDSLSEDIKTLLYRNLYANVISCLEAYLSDTAIRRIMSNPELKCKFVENSNKFQSEKIKLSDIYKTFEKLDKKIEERLREIIYHNLDVVSSLYQSTFGIDFGNIKELKKAVSIRHDIVHRNGYNKSGKLNNITKKNVIQLIDTVSMFIENIESAYHINSLNK